MVYTILPAADNVGMKYDAARDLYEQQGIYDAHAAMPAARVRSLFRPLSAPAVHPNPPTIGTIVDVVGKATTDATGSAMTYPVCIPYYLGGVAANGENTRRFRSLGWSRTVAGSGGALALGRATHPNASMTAGSMPSSVEFMFDGTGFEFRLYTYYSDRIVFQVYVDDLPISATSQTILGTSVGHAYLVPVTFGSSGMRQVRIEFDRQGAFGGLIIDNSAFTVATPADGMLQGYLIGDSYADGANGVASLDTYAMQLGRLLNLDMWVDGQGGTGAVATGGGGSKGNYLSRLPAMASEARLSPDFVFIQDSTNDGVDASTAAQVQPNITSLISSVKTMWPKAKIQVIGLMLMTSPNTLTATNVTNHVGARTAASAADVFVDPAPGLTVAGQTGIDGWYTGSGNTGSTGNAGNTGRYRGVDNIHGTAAWHAMAARENAAIAASLAA